MTSNSISECHRTVCYRHDAESCEPHPGGLCLRGCQHGNALWERPFAGEWRDSVPSNQTQSVHISRPAQGLLAGTRKLLCHRGQAQVCQKGDFCWGRQQGILTLMYCVVIGQYLGRSSEFNFEQKNNKVQRSKSHLNKVHRIKSHLNKVHRTKSTSIKYPELSHTLKKYTELSHISTQYTEISQLQSKLN